MILSDVRIMCLMAYRQARLDVRGNESRDRTCKSHGKDGLFPQIERRPKAVTASVGGLGRLFYYSDESPPRHKRSVDANGRGLNSPFFPPSRLGGQAVNSPCRDEEHPNNIE